MKDQADGSAELVYELTPNSAPADVAGTQLTSSVAGTWGATEESARAATTTSTNYTVTTSDQKIYFIRKTGTGESKSAETVFQIDGKRGSYKIYCQQRRSFRRLWWIHEDLKQ